jgi:predicted flavoprotein YhiN
MAKEVDRIVALADGVGRNGIDPAKLESRPIAGLFFAAEVLDLAGSRGGLNLRAVFSTGWLAGPSAAHRCLPG